MAIVWPSVLNPRDVLFHIQPMQDAGPRSFSGKRQVGVVDFGYWMATLSDFPVQTDDLILEWRGIIADLNGEDGELIIGPFDKRRAPSNPATITGIPHSDGTLFSDGTGYSQSLIKVSAAAAADLRATTITVDIQQSGALKRGMYFSITDLDTLKPRLYMITKTPLVDGASADLVFRPPLRRPLESGQTLNFADPKATMTLSGPDVGKLELLMNERARPSIDLIESWPE